MFCRKIGSLDLKLEVVPVESLLLHEKTFPRIVERLILEFKNWANLQNPIIVDEKNVVLDGNHRAFVFKKLKFKYIPVCKTDYFHENVKLRYWFRLLQRIDSVDLLRRIVEDMNGTVQEVRDSETLKKILQNNHLSCGIQRGSVYAVIRFNEDVVNDAVSAYNVLERLQDTLMQKGITVKYISDHRVHEPRFCSELEHGEMVIWTPHITKEMVIDAAKSGKVFAPRTTRHLIPPRPLNVNVPTGWFKEDISLEEINMRFSKFLEGKHLRRFGPGQLIDGRYYGEEVCIFFDRTE
jgi:hypothetical protein